MLTEWEAVLAAGHAVSPTENDWLLRRGLGLKWTDFHFKSAKLPEMGDYHPFDAHDTWTYSEDDLNECMVGRFKPTPYGEDEFTQQDKAWYRPPKERE